MEKSYKVLVAEDDEDIRDVIVASLSDWSEISEVKAVENGKEALEVARCEDIDFVISDISMPEMSGIEFLKKLKEEKIGLVTIILTGIATVENAIHALKFGAFDFLEKPIELDEFSHALRMAMAYLEDSKKNSRGVGGSEEIFNVSDIVKENLHHVETIEHGSFIKTSLSCIYRNLIRIQHANKNLESVADDMLLTIHKLRSLPSSLGPEDLKKIRNFHQEIEAIMGDSRQVS